MNGFPGLAKRSRLARKAAALLTLASGLALCPQAQAQRLDIGALDVSLTGPAPADFGAAPSLGPVMPTLEAGALSPAVQPLPALPVLGPAPAVTPLATTPDPSFSPAATAVLGAFEEAAKSSPEPSSAGQPAERWSSVFDGGAARRLAASEPEGPSRASGQAGALGAGVRAISESDVTDTLELAQRFPNAEEANLAILRFYYSSKGKLDWSQTKRLIGALRPGSNSAHTRERILADWLEGRSVQAPMSAGVEELVEAAGLFASAEAANRAILAFFYRAKARLDWSQTKVLLDAVRSGSTASSRASHDVTTERILAGWSDRGGL